MATAAKAALQAQKLEAVADRGYFNGEEILACEQGGITVTLPKPMTSGAKSDGRFGKQDFVYLQQRMSIVARRASADLPVHERGGRQGAAPLLDDRMFETARIKAVAPQAAASDRTMGARARARGRAARLDKTHRPCAASRDG